MFFFLFFYRELSSEICEITDSWEMSWYTNYSKKSPKIKTISKFLAPRPEPVTKYNQHTLVLIKYEKFIEFDNIFIILWDGNYPFTNFYLFAIWKLISPVCGSSMFPHSIKAGVTLELDGLKCCERWPPNSAISFFHSMSIKRRFQLYRSLV